MNILPVQNQLQIPRSLVKVNGQVLPGWIEWEVNNNTHRQADTFRVCYACGNLPAAQNAKWLISQTAIQVQIFVGFPPDPVKFSASQLQSIILGDCDALNFDPVQNIIELSGRDMASEMIDTKTSEKFVNQKASDIAKTIASRHGLTPDVDDTGSPDGTYYEIDHARLNNAQTEWDLLCELADNQGYNVWVDGMTLHFKQQDESSMGTYVIQWIPPGEMNASPQANVMSLKFMRNNMISQKNISVKVNSWNIKQKAKLTGSATSTKSSSDDNWSLNYEYNEPGLTQDQADTRAKERLKGIIRNEMCLNADLPGDNILNTRVLIQVTGTGTPFDQTYWPVSVSRRFGMSEGYRMSAEAKNHSPETEVDS
jgi:phage protein D